MFILSFFSDEDITVNQEIESDKQPSEIRLEPLSLPVGFVWDTLDINDPLIVSDLEISLHKQHDFMI